VSCYSYSVACELKPFWVREPSPLGHQTRASPSLWDWPDIELARIRRVLHRLAALRVPNEEDAEDLVQETLLTMAVKCTAVDLEKGLLIWGMGILRNKVGNYYRKMQRSAANGNGLAPRHDSMGVTSGEQSAESRLLYLELRELIDEVLAGFALQQRLPLELLMEGYSTGEIAEMLEPERYQNILNRLHRGRKKLARQLSKQGYAPLRR